MAQAKDAVGAYGERVAVAHLLAQGMVLLDRTGPSYAWTVTGAMAQNATSPTLTISPLPAPGSIVTVSVTLTNALGRIGMVEQFVRDPDISFLIGTLTGRVPDFSRIPLVERFDIIDATVKEIAGDVAKSIRWKSY